MFLLLQWCHSEERSDEESLLIRLLGKERFFASLRMTIVLLLHAR